VLLSGEIAVPRSSIERLELGLDKKRHWLDGLLVGLGVGLVMGLTEKVDPVVCKVDEYVPCTRTGALVEDPLIGGAVGAGVGALVNTPAWTPVAPEALVVQPAREARNRRPGVQFTIRF
jgi:hypothetical protein